MPGFYRFNPIGAVHTKAVIAVGCAAAILMSLGAIGWGIARSNDYQRQADTLAYTNLKRLDAESRRACTSARSACSARFWGEAREFERAEQDLVAQRQSALWAFVTGVAAAAGMGLSIIGVFLVWTTFQATKTANQIAQVALDYQIRPWIKLTVSFGRIIVSDADLIVKACIRCSNKGQSPANRLSLSAFILEPDPKLS